MITKIEIPETPELLCCLDCLKESFSSEDKPHKGQICAYCGSTNTFININAHPPCAYEAKNDETITQPKEYIHTNTLTQQEEFQYIELRGKKKTHEEYLEFEKLSNKKSRLKNRKKYNEYQKMYMRKKRAGITN